VVNEMTKITETTTGEWNWLSSKIGNKEQSSDLPLSSIIRHQLSVVCYLIADLSFPGQDHPCFY